MLNSSSSVNLVVHVFKSCPKSFSEDMITYQPNSYSNEPLKRVVISNILHLEIVLCTFALSIRLTSSFKKYKQTYFSKKKNSESHVEVSRTKSRLKAYGRHFNRNCGSQVTTYASRGISDSILNQ